MRDHQYWADITTIADKTRRPQLDASLLDAQKSSMFSYLLMTLNEDTKNQVNNTKVRLHFGSFETYSLALALFAHTHPSIVFMPFNASVWRLPEKADFRGSGRFNTLKEGVYVPMDEVYAQLTEN